MPGARLASPEARGPNPDCLENLRHFPGPQHGVNLGNLAPELVAIALGQAAGDDEARAPAIALLRGHLEDGVDRFLLGGIDEGARVDDEHLGVRGVGRNLVAGLAGHAQHHLAVDEVLGTAEAEKTYLHF